MSSVPGLVDDLETLQVTRFQDKGERVDDEQSVQAM